MAHVTTELDAAVPAQAILGALTDFSDRRAELWPNIDRSYYKVHEVKGTTAEVTEGSKGVWERTRYDWSEPGKVRIEVQDSNAFQPGSWWLYSVQDRPAGGSHVRLEFDRRPRNARGLAVGALLGLFGERIFGQFLAETVRRLELRASRAARQGAGPAPSPR
jgi:hypothetical protein